MSLREEYMAEEIRINDQKINWTNANADVKTKTKNSLIAMLCQKECNNSIHAFDDVVSKTREIIQEGRSNDIMH